MPYIIAHDPLKSLSNWLYGSIFFISTFFPLNVSSSLIILYYDTFYSPIMVLLRYIMQYRILFSRG